MDRRDLMYAMGGPLQAFQNIDAYRNKLRDIPEFHGMDPQDQAGFDRYTQMAQYGQDFGPEAPFWRRMLAPAAGVLGAGLLGANELSKSLRPETPFSQQWLASATGDPSFMPSAASSQPSWSNIMSGMGGLVEGIAPGLFR